MGLCIMPVHDAAADIARVEVATTKGTFILELDRARAPITTANFLQYVRDDFYHGLIFHRVIDGFVIQGGGYDRNMNERPTRASIRNEARNGLGNVAYSIAMARTSDPDSAGSQFYINLKDNAFLNHSASNPGYAVFGKVISGFEVIDEIAAVSTRDGSGHQDVPVTPVVIDSMELID